MNNMLKAHSVINAKVEHNRFIFLVSGHNMDFCYV